MPNACLSVKFRNRLIGETVRAAARDSVFYGRLYEGLDLTAIQSVDDLATLPTVDKFTLASAGQSALCPPEAGPTIAIQNTSGTTGAPFWLHRSQSEQAFISEFFEDWNSRHAVADGPTPLVLQLLSDRHGIPTGVPSNVFPFNCRLSDESSVEKAIAILAGRFNIKGAESQISAIAGSHDDLVALTSYLTERGISPASAFNVRCISPIGRYLTRRLLGFLKSAWDCRVTQRYSMAEIFGGANWIDELGAYVFDPYLVPEVLPFTDGPPITVGLGRLHLTGLRPFSILQPLIRYRTGDLFDVATSDNGNTLHLFRGRECHALFHPNAKDQLLACGLAVLEALDPYPDFNRDAYATDIGLGDPSTTGWPRSRGRIAAKGQGFAFTIEVETRCDLRLFPERSEQLRREILARFLDAAPMLQARVDTGEADVGLAFAPPGSLSAFERTSKYWRW